jgi:hypothetical protein
MRHAATIRFWLCTAGVALAAGCSQDPAPAKVAPLPDASDISPIFTDAKDSEATPDTVVAADTVTTEDATPDAVVAPDAEPDADLDVAIDTPVDPGRNPACGPYDNGTYGQKVPWTGFEQGGKTYTCNACRGGYAVDQGSWRAIDFATEDPTTPLGDDYKEALTFDGNTFSMHISGLDLGAPTEAVIEGWMWCADPAEMKSGNSVFVVTKVQPEGAFGWNSGLVFSGNLKHSGANLLAWGFFMGFEKDWVGEALYCRIGTMIGSKPCEDPFGT